MRQRNLGIIYLVLVIVGILLVVFFLPQKSQNKSGKISVVASFYPLYFFSSQIGGDKADVANITPAGAEPHDYEPTAQDIAQIENSKLLVLNGGGLEAWASNIKQNINPKKTILVVAGDGLTNQQITEAGQVAVDPHVWLSPQLAGKMVDKILQGFSQADPQNKDYYQVNASNLKLKLADLDNSYKLGLKNCAEKNIITSHAAFGYLAAAYGLKQISIAGLSPDAEPSPAQLADIVKFAKANNVKYIFFESLASPKLSQTIANEIGAKTLVLNPIEGLTKEEISQGSDYFSEMVNNLANLQIALKCQ